MGLPALRSQVHYATGDRLSAALIEHFGRKGLVDFQQYCNASADKGERLSMWADSREQPHWYAIQTWSRHEKMGRDQLAAKHITHLLPLWRKRSLRQDRVKYVEVPLFTQN